MDIRRWSVPAAFFAMVLGLTGLGNDWRAASKLWGLPSMVGELTMLVAGIVWAILVLLYAQKWLTQGTAARDEIAHPIQCCFVSLVPISTMLVGIGVLPHWHAAAVVVCAAGAVGTVAFGVWRHGGLWRGGRSDSSTTPVLYLPTVAANLVSATAAASLGWPELGQMFFGAGVLAWLAVESVILHRLLTAEELKTPLRPTLGIQLAPPSVALLAYSTITTGPVDLVARMLLGYGLFQALLLLRLMPWIRQPFTPGYWGFTFGVTAIAAGVMRFAQRGDDRIFMFLAPILFTVANVVVLGLFAATIHAAAKGTLVPKFPLATSPPTWTP